MYLLGLQIIKDRRDKKYSMKSCYTCGKVIWVMKEQLRVYNYCSEC